MASSINVYLRGGLGNQLFQYAAGLFHSVKLGKELVIRDDLLPEIDDKVGHANRFVNQIESFEHCARVISKSHQPENSTNLQGKIMYAQRLLGDRFPTIFHKMGIWAEESRSNPIHLGLNTNLKTINSYASNIAMPMENRQTLISEISKIKNPSAEYLRLLAESGKKQPIMVHVRLGDYLNLQHIYGKLNLDYFKKALVSLGKQKETPVWLFTQDSAELPAELLDLVAPELVIEEKVLNAPIENLMLMAQGSGLVCSNSTLSWWAAFLSSEVSRIAVPQIDGKTNIFGEHTMRAEWVGIHG